MFAAMPAIRSGIALRVLKTPGNHLRPAALVTAALLSLQVCGCQGMPTAPARTAEPTASAEDTAVPDPADPDWVTVAGGVDEEPVPEPASFSVTTESPQQEEFQAPAGDDFEWEELDALVAAAEVSNPRLHRLQQEAAAAWAKVRHIDKLPDPTIGANIFGHPIETAAGSQRASLTVMQMIPWLKRLDAQSREAAFEAMAVQQVYHAERLQVITDVRVAWYKLYVLGKQIETTQANQELLETLIDVATARLVAGDATQGDVLLGTVELSRLDEQLVRFEQQVASTTAELNRQIGRPADTFVPIPDRLDPSFPGWKHDALLAVARRSQPEIAAAELRTAASRWGLEVARLKQRPDLSFSATWFAIEGNRPPTAIVDVGRDAWAVGVQMSVPLWHQKYQAMRDEATWETFASQSAVEDLLRRYDALLRDLLAQAEAAAEIAALYRETIIPQSRQTLETDQRAFAEDVVEFDRVIQNFRNLLTLELAYHQSLGEWAIAVARLEQAVGIPLPEN